VGKFIPVEPEKWAEMVKAWAEVARLKAEVERLTKAGDAMADRLIYQGYPETVQRWNAAKEGKQS
jgi:hypothetical protein